MTEHIDLLHLQTELITRIDAIQRQVEEIHAAIASNHKSGIPGIDEYRSALEAMAEGDMAPLKSYLKRGGMVPKAETLFPDMAGNGHKKTVCLTAERSGTATARGVSCILPRRTITRSPAGQT